VDSFVEGVVKKTMNRNVRAMFLGIAAAGALAATIDVAAATFTPPPKRDHVMTNPCARVMNWPHRALVAFSATPPSERGLQCPIEEILSVPADE
jgi:hypothetical protein